MTCSVWQMLANSPQTFQAWQNLDDMVVPQKLSARKPLVWGSSPKSILLIAMTARIGIRETVTKQVILIHFVCIKVLAVKCCSDSISNFSPDF